MAKKVGIEIVVDDKGSIRKLNKLGDSGEKATEKIDKGSKGASESMSMLNSKTVIATGSLVAMSYATGKLVKGFIDAGVETTKQAQKVETQFKTILGSAELARERYEELANFASSTPFQLNGVAKASKILETLTAGTLSTGEGLRLVGDASAIAGVEFEELAVSIGRAYSGLQSNRAVGEPIARLQELGLISGETRNEIEKLQAQSKGKEAWVALRAELEKTKGGMSDLANTIEGKTSTIVDNIGLISSQLIKSSGAQSVWETALSKVSNILDNLNSGLKEREALQAGDNKTLSQALLVQSALNEEYSKANIYDQSLIKSLQARIEKNNNLVQSLKQVKAEEDKAKQAKLEQEAIDKRNTELGGLAELQAQADAKNEIINLALQYELEQYNKNLQDKRELDYIAYEEWTQIEEKKLQEQQNRDKIEIENKKKLLKQEYFARVSSNLMIGQASNNLLKEMFGNNKAFTVADIGLSTARGIMSALAMVPPNVPLAGIIGATGAVQAGKAISAKYQDGGVIGGDGTNRSDSIPILVSNGESVLNSKATNNLGESGVNALNSGAGIGSNYNITVNAGAGSDGNAIAQMVANAIRDIQRNNIEAEPVV